MCVRVCVSSQSSSGLQVFFFPLSNRSTFSSKDFSEHVKVDRKRDVNRHDAAAKSASCVPALLECTQVYTQIGFSFRNIYYILYIAYLFIYPSIRPPTPLGFPAAAAAREAQSVIRSMENAVVKGAFIFCRGGERNARHRITCGRTCMRVHFYFLFISFRTHIRWEKKK